MSELVINSAQPALQERRPEPGTADRRDLTTSRIPASYSVEVATNRDEMETHRGAWELLATRTAEPNVWYEPWMLLPAVDAFGADVPFRFAYIYRTAPGPQAARELCGVFPFEVIRPARWSSCQVWRLWRHLHCFLGTPLIHRDHAADVWTALFDWAAAEHPAPWWLDLSHQPAEGMIWQSLVDVARERQQVIYPVETFHRAYLVHGDSFDRYCHTQMSAHCRQELGRKRRRLGELGRLELRMLDHDSPIEVWLEQFLDVESRGWKGRETSALASDPAQRAFFENLACGAFVRHRLHLMGLFLDGRPIAMKCNLLASPGSFSFKIGFDESLSKYSPGVLLEWDNTKWLLEQSEIQWMDSCAKPGHFMIGQLWKDRRQLHRLLIPTCRRGELTLGARPLLQTLRRMTRGK